MSHLGELPPLPPRPSDGHKGTFGHVLIVGGSRGMSGAAVLAGRAALRSGTGLVTVAVPDEIASIVAAAEPSCLTAGLPADAAGRLAECRRQLEPFLTRATVAAIGPGLGRSATITDLVAGLFEGLEQPLVVDADGLNALSAAGAVLQTQRPASAGTRVLTPHPGEFARLCRACRLEPPGSDSQSRREAAAEFARRTNCVVILKGARSVITDGQHVAVNMTGNSGMATGGSGDVLTGLVAGLLAQGLDAFDAARLAAHVHGLAGDLAAAALSQRGLIASDLPVWIARAWLHLEHEQGPTQD